MGERRSHCADSGIQRSHFFFFSSCVSFPKTIRKIPGDHEFKTYRIFSLGKEPSALGTNTLDHFLPFRVAYVFSPVTLLLLEICPGERQCDTDSSLMARGELVFVSGVIGTFTPLGSCQLDEICCLKSWSCIQTLRFFHLMTWRLKSKSRKLKVFQTK